MNKVEINIDDAQKHLYGFIGISRWVWSANLVIMIAAIATRHYLPAVIAGPTSLMMLTATAYARRVAKHLETAKQATIVASAPLEPKQHNVIEVFERAA